MSLQQNERDRIDHYLNGELSGIELAGVQNRMKEDALFNNQVVFHEILRGGIVISKEEELKKIILGKINYKKSRIPFALKLILTFLLVTSMGITLWFYIGTDTYKQNRRDLLSPFLSNSFDKKADKKLSESKNKGLQKTDRSSGSVQEKETGDETIGNQEAEKTENNGNSMPEADTTHQVSEEDKDIVIRKDKLLISTTLTIIEKPASDDRSTDLQNEHSASTQEAIRKLNPDAGVPEEEKNSNYVLVEFWVSPVNYMGYKMSRNKIILFGLEEPDAVKLFRANDILYLKYGIEYFRLVQTFDFLSYQRLKEAEVPLAIRQ